MASPVDCGLTQRGDVARKLVAVHGKRVLIVAE